MAVLAGKPAPDFTSVAVMADGSINENFNLKEYLAGDYGLLFFYPLDFTFVCPSEILAFNNRMAKFKELGVKVVACSIDSQFTHIAWRNTSTKEGGLGPVDFPMVADVTKQVARDYDVLIEEAGVALRGTFLIGKDGLVWHQTVNNLPLGRNVDEFVRLVEALQFHEEHGEVCPAGWNKGDEGMKADAAGVADYLSKHASEL
ncbi:peroxiredoxin [Kordiimonas marina]|uniref:peroxiredoxin n=1 Tax=Kordiimonas marina TaxID=2872312 RepID=UPI001FF37283|nr:peroxiredoxin [Kordiimonas marina]MCJ9429685.1 peroxiredoxin [Kordiimonas marina]